MNAKKITLIAVITLGAILVFVITYVGVQIYLTWDQMHDEAERESEQIESPESRDRNQETKTFLILGIDDEEGTIEGRSDVIMLKTVNFENEEILSVSLPRDTRTRLAELETKEKLGHAFAYGTNVAIETIEEFLDIPVDYYIALNFDAFINFIDLIGGLRVDVEREMKVAGISLEPGKQTLNGEEALTYVRFRDDSEGTFGRRRRQQQVISEIMDQSLDFRTATRIIEALDIAGENIQHNIPFSNFTEYSQKLSSVTAENYQSMFIISIPEIIDEIWYVKLSDKEQDYIRETFLNRIENKHE